MHFDVLLIVLKHLLLSVCRGRVIKITFFSPLSSSVWANNQINMRQCAECIMDVHAGVP